MKMSQELKQAQANMQPGVILPGGFLGSDVRPLADIIAADEAAMRHLGLDWTELADRMRLLLGAGLTGLGEPVAVGDHWRVVASDTRGRLASPWEDGLFGKETVTVSLADGQSLVFNELCVFLAERHHFLQGRGSPFRLEPEDLARVLFPGGHHA